MRERWTPEKVLSRIEEAVDTERKLPRVKAIGYQNYWPDVVRRASDVFGHGAYYEHSSDMAPRRDRPLPVDLTRMDEVNEWLLKMSKPNRKMVIWKARGKSNRFIGRRLRMNHATVKTRLGVVLRRTSRFLNWGT